MHQPREVYWTTTLRILTYIRSSPEKGLLHKKHGHVRIFGYSDSGNAGDKGDRKSTTDYCTFTGGILVTYRSKKQDVFRSSAEIEYKVMTYTNCEMMWLKKSVIRV